MSTPQFTPGPWHSRVVPAGFSIEGKQVAKCFAHEVVIGGVGHTIAHTQVEMADRAKLTKSSVTLLIPATTECPPLHPDACLVESSPDLYETLEDLVAEVSLVEFTDDDGGGRYQPIYDLLSRADKILAKARGEVTP